MEQPDLDDVARRSQKYWDVDGLPELMMGLLWMLWGGAWLFGEALPDDWRADAFWTAVPALLAGSGVAAIWATKRLKQRLTFPRTGYVDWKEPSRSARLMAGGVAMVTAMVLATVATHRDMRIRTRRGAVARCPPESRVRRRQPQAACAALSCARGGCPHAGLGIWRPSRRVGIG